MPALPPLPPTARPAPAGSPTDRRHARESDYRVRVLGSAVAALLAVIAAFSVADQVVFSRSERVFDSAPVEVVEVIPTPQTRQAAMAPPPPPPPLPPVEVPDYVQIPDEPLDFEQRQANPDPAPRVEVLPAPPGPPAPKGGSPGFVERPQRLPIPSQYSYPQFSEEAQDKVRARIRVEVLVDERGRVEEAAIVERVLVGRGDEERAVASVGYGVEEAVLEAARAYRFRPARHEGKPVSTRTTIGFKVGV